MRVFQILLKFIPHLIAGAFVTAVIATSSSVNSSIHNPPAPQIKISASTTESMNSAPVLSATIKEAVSHISEKKKRAAEPIAIIPMQSIATTSIIATTTPILPPTPIPKPPIIEAPLPQPMPTIPLRVPRPTREDDD